MDLTGRRESSNVDDRRRMSTATKAGVGGLAGIIIACLMAWLSGGDVFQAFQQAGGLEHDIDGKRKAGSLLPRPVYICACYIFSLAGKGCGAKVTAGFY